MKEDQHKKNTKEPDAENPYKLLDLKLPKVEN